MTDLAIIVSDVIKVAAILVSLFHFLLGAILFRDLIKINRTVRTKNSPFFTLLGFAYLVFLLIVLVVFIFAN